MQISLIPCLSDNYAYLIEAAGAVAVVDPSEPEPVLRILRDKGLHLTHILNTHHHFDHTGGNLPLKEQFGATIIGPAADSHRIPGLDQGVGEDDVVTLGDTRWTVMNIPAHTSGHIAFWGREQAAVFTGDTLFAMGCGRLFEGTPAQMWASLQKLVALPPDTRVYCGHEYTLSNGRFALTVDIGNADLHARMTDVESARLQGRPTIPSSIALERATNPFLRATEAALASAVGLAFGDPVAVFAELRRLKDSFKG